jgi:uncharacterized membrane protein (Fun14 family)
MDALSLTASAGGGLLAGLVVGLAVRRALSFLLTLAGLFVLGLAGLSYVGLAQVDFNGILSRLNDLFVRGVELGGQYVMTFGGPAFSIPFAAGSLFGLLLPGRAGAVHVRRRRVLR